jgi:mannose-6-phosphate isomerase-like protein (cupin superfamily)
MDGVGYKLGRVSLVVKRSESETDGAYTVIESTESPGGGAGLHRHPRWDETFIVCEGSYDFRCGEERARLGPGDSLFVPRGTPHGFVCIGPECGRLIIVSSPGGLFEAFIREVIAAAVDTGGPSGGAAGGLRAIAAHHGVEFMTEPS